MPVDWTPLWLSLRVAGLATLASLPAAIGLAYALRDRARGSALAALPLAFPPVIVCAWLFCTHAKRDFQWQLAAAAGILFALPFLARAARAAFLEVEPQYFAAARILGAGEGRICCLVAVPLAWRGLAAAVSLVFARLLGEFALVLVLAGRTPAAPVLFALAAIALLSVYAGQLL